MNYTLWLRLFDKVLVSTDANLLARLGLKS